MKVPASWKSKYKGHRCFVMGTGPSILKQNLRPLRNEITVGCNLIYKRFVPQYLTVSDPGVYWQHFRELMMIHQRTKLVVSSRCGRVFMGQNPDGRKVCWWPEELKPPEDIVTVGLTTPKWWQHGARFFPNFDRTPVGGTVSVNLAIPLAVHLGCNPIYLIGCDSDNTGDFCQPLVYDNAWKMNGSKIITSYRNIKKVFEQSGGRIYNATAGGELEVFKRVPYKELF